MQSMRIASMGTFGEIGEVPPRRSEDVLRGNRQQDAIARWDFSTKGSRTTRAKQLASISNTTVFCDFLFRSRFCIIAESRSRT